MVGRLYRIDGDAAKKHKLQVGDRVTALVKWGGNSRYLTVNPAHLTKVPDTVDPAEAACLAETYLTAFQVIHFGQSPGARYKKNSLSKRTILVIGSMMTKLGRAIQQIASHSNVKTMYATAKSKHAAQLREEGVQPLSTNPNEWLASLRHSIDLVIVLDEEVNPLYHSLVRGNLIVVKNGGSAAPAAQALNSPTRVCSRNDAHNKSKTVVYDVFSEWDRRLALCKKDLAYLLHALELRALAPHILDRIPLAKVARAQDLMENKRLSGFLVCEPWLVTKSRAITL